MQSTTEAIQLVQHNTKDIISIIKKPKIINEISNKH